MTTNEMDVGLLRQLVRYEPETGLLYHRRTFLGGKIAGTTGPRGYVRLTLFGRSFSAGRVAWALYHGSWPMLFIDHINGIRNDNRITNLRQVTIAENNKNTKVTARNKTGCPGVVRKPNGRWRARIISEGRNLYLGTFDLFEDAEAACKAAWKQNGFLPEHGTKAPATPEVEL